MLVLSRKSKQSIQIGPDIEIQVLELRADTVKIGIKAPRHVTVYRSELFDAIAQANKASALAGPAAPESLERVSKLLPTLPNRSNDN
ncbi:MAG TPA: carbon storage regulator CsrA [Opitutales bacterium]|nr:carbon storage regulator CsrA [Opitutales bacterium]